MIQGSRGVKRNRTLSMRNDAEDADGGGKRAVR
jgi:hypothetical protein